MIPYLKKAGIEFLHIGVNPASAVPSVPALFRWQADNGDKINVMYNAAYGEFSEIGDTGTAVCFAHTGDNHGVQSADNITGIFEDLRKEYPSAEIVAGNLNDLALAVREIEETLPIVTDEIGDSWIHGVGTDPKKVAQFRALERFYSELPECEDKQILARGLIMIPEHTWGLNVHTHLGDHEHYNRDDFNEACKIFPNFKKMEKSRQEQRNYLIDTVNGLSDEKREKAVRLMAECERSNERKLYPSELIAETDPSLLNFNNIKPMDSVAVYFNLYNNVWGTNFPMWYDENARFRLILRVN